MRINSKIIKMFILIKTFSRGVLLSLCLSLSFAYAEEFSSFRVKYLINSKRGEISLLQKGELVYKEKKGYREETVVMFKNKETKETIISNFSRKKQLRYDYLAKKIEVINYASIPLIENFPSQFIHLSILDLFLPYQYNVLRENSILKEGEEKFKDKEFEVMGGIIAKSPLLGRRCKFWQSKENQFVYKFIVYNEKDEPILTLEVTEVEIDPEIPDEKFSTEIPPEFREVDISEQFAQQYRILVQLYKLYAKNEKLEEINKILQEENEELRKKLEEEEKKGLIGKGEIARVRKEPMVLLVDRILKFVIIGIGESEAVVLGDIFEVYRGSRNLGRILVNRIYQDMAVAEPITEGLIEIVREGDRLVKAGFENK